MTPRKGKGPAILSPITVGQIWQVMLGVLTFVGIIFGADQRMDAKISTAIKGLALEDRYVTRVEFVEMLGGVKMELSNLKHEIRSLRKELKGGRLDGMD